jgi:carbamoyl-phosphate synthase large subunit
MAAREKLTILLTGVGGRSVGHQVLCALRLAQTPYRVVCTDADPFSFGLYDGDARAIVPLASSPDYSDAICALIRRHGVQVVIPGTEPEVLALSAIRPRLEDHGAFLIASPPEAIALCADKMRLHDWLTAKGYGTPRSATAQNWRALAETVGFPLIGKPTRQSGGSRGVSILADREEVEDYIAQFPGDGSALAIQEYVGDADSEFTVGVVVGRSGAAIDSIVLHRKLIGLSLGATRDLADGVASLSTGYSQGFIVEDAEISALCERLAVDIGARGPVNVQLRRARDGLKVFEVHTRFSGTASIRATAGFNEPDMVIRDHVLGEHIGRQHHRTGVAAIRAFTSRLVPIADMDAVPRPLYGGE